MSKNQFPFADDSIFFNVFSYLGLPLSRDFSSDQVDAVVMGIPMTWAPVAAPALATVPMVFARPAPTCAGRASAGPGILPCPSG